MFTATEGHGFQMKFANGWTISVQWGPWNYCDNKDIKSSFGKRPKLNERRYECKNAEIAVIKPDGEFYQFENDSVVGWRTPDQVASLIAFVSGNPMFIDLVG